MNTLKRLTTILLVLIFVFSLVACESDKQPDVESTNDSQATESVEISDDESSDDESSDDESSNNESELSADVNTYLIGSWKGDVNLSALMSQIWTEAFGFDCSIELVLSMKLDFSADSKCKLCYDEDSSMVALEKFSDDIYTEYTKYATSNGVEVMSKDEFIESSGFSAASLYEDLNSEFNGDSVEGSYTVNGNIINIDGEELVFDGTTLSLDLDMYGDGTAIITIVFEKE